MDYFLPSENKLYDRLDISLLMGMKSVLIVTGTQQSLDLSILGSGLAPPAGFQWTADCGAIVAKSSSLCPHPRPGQSLAQ